MQSMIPKKCIWTVANPQTDVAYLYFIKKNQTMESEWIGDLNYISIQVQVSWHCSSLTSFDAVIVNIWNSCEHYGDCLNLHHMFGRSQSPGWIDICSVSQQHCTFKTGSYKAANRKKKISLFYYSKSCLLSLSSSHIFYHKGQWCPVSLSTETVLCFKLFIFQFSQFYQEITFGVLRPGT